MQRITTLFALGLFLTSASAQTTITVMDGVIFHDGYAGLVPDVAPQPNIIKLRNDLFARKLTATELGTIGSTLQMRIVIGALCDNYDRIGNVNMAFVPVGAETYDPNAVEHIELGRFITPFMNKNIQPDSVVYSFNVDNVARLLKDTELTSAYDLWIELAVFGVPYAANTEVAGCAGRNDVFSGKLTLTTNDPVAPQDTDVLMPLFFNANFNNYQAGATDTLGLTTRSITFNVEEELTDAAFFLITSNHGANQGGEEYIRRFHYAYFDGALELTYRPGRTTCEPFRQFNTQPNGIYGTTPRTPAQWQSFSNWCPGDVIDIRRIDLGPMSAGTHTFMIRVPAATFAGGQGNFPLSLYLHGTTSGQLSSVGLIEREAIAVSLHPNPSDGASVIVVPSAPADITVTNTLGEVVLQQRSVDQRTTLRLTTAGMYLVHVTTPTGKATRKWIVK
ncbi:MAG: T9SS type A sorting domain-containing protein [Flavobacteriales bacterium]|nr:T9SS type A sorting domain-containing protein [Flavobacteriales bacterium]